MMPIRTLPVFQAGKGIICVEGFQIFLHYVYDMDKLYNIKTFFTHTLLQPCFPHGINVTCVDLQPFCSGSSANGPLHRFLGLLPASSSKSSYDEVPCHFSVLFLPRFASAASPHCQHSDKEVRVLARGVVSSAERKPTVLIANHNQRDPRSSV